MRKTEYRIMGVLSWFHAVLIFSGFYIWLPTTYVPADVAAEINLLPVLYLFIPVILSYLFLRKISNMLLYLAAGAIVMFGMYKMTGDLLTLICGSMIFLIRCYTRIERGRVKRLMREYPGEDGKFYAPEVWEIPTFLDKPEIFHCGIFLIQYLTMLASGHPEHLKELFYLWVAEVVIIFAHHYIDQMQKYVKGREKIANLPSVRILRNGYMIFYTMLLLFLVVLLPSVLYVKEPLANVHFVFPAIDFDLLLETNGVKADPMMEMLYMLYGKARPTPAWLLMISEVISWCVVIFGLGLLFIQAVKVLEKMLGTYTEQEEDEVIDLKKAEEETVRLKREKKREDRKIRKTLEYQIRQMYRKKILRGRKEKPKGNETPTELEERLREGDVADRRSFHEVYEKARYSSVKITEEEFQRFQG